MLYAGLNLVVRRAHVGRVVAGMGVICGLAGLLSAVQLTAGWAVATESARQELTLEGALVGTLNPAALLTLLSPYVLATPDTGIVAGGIRYEMLNVGCVGLLLAIFGCCCGERRFRGFLLVLAVVCGVVALGSATPVFGLLYGWLPGFSMFRAVVRLTFLASLCLAMLAGAGFEAMAAGGLRVRRMAVAGVVLGLAVLALGAVAHESPKRSGGGAWSAIVSAMDPSGNAARRLKAIPARRPGMPNARWAAKALYSSGGLLVAASVLIWYGDRRLCRFGLVLLAGLEMAVTARMSVSASSLPLPCPAAWKQELTKLPKDARYWQTRRGADDYAMQTGQRSATGYEAAWLARYMTLYDCCGTDHMPTTEELRRVVEKVPALGRMMPVGLILQGPPRPATTPPLAPMGRVALVPSYRLVRGPHEAMAEVAGGAFDAAQVALLESDPGIVCGVPGPNDAARVTAESTDWMEIEARTSVPTVLLVTDTYSRYWRARAMGGSAQAEYRVMPADGMVRAVPLSAGIHRIHMEYRPSGMTAAWSVMAAAWLAWGVGLGWRRRSNAH